MARNELDKSVKELCDGNIEVVKGQLRRIHLRVGITLPHQPWFITGNDRMPRFNDSIGP